jgi:hypothetical protein
VTGADQRPTPNEEKTGARNLTITDPASWKRRNKEIYFTGKFLPLATSLLMGDPKSL